MCWAVVSLDTGVDAIDRSAWADWLHLGNLVAGLQDQAVITTTRTGRAEAPEPPIPDPGYAEPADDTIERLLEDSFDEGARDLAAAAAALGHTDLVVGFETEWPDGTLFEIAWPAAMVAVLPAGSKEPSESFGWMVRSSDAWTEDELIAALESRGTRTDADPRLRKAVPGRLHEAGANGSPEGQGAAREVRALGDHGCAPGEDRG
jgi:hypothetical protein